MAYEYTLKHYALQRQLSLRYSYLRNLPVDHREDALNFSVVQALIMAQGHDERRCPFRARLIRYTWKWTLRYYANRTKFWRKDADKVNVVFSEDPPELSRKSDPLRPIIVKERAALARSVANNEWQKMLDLAEAGNTYTEIALRIGKSRQAVQQAFWAVRDRVLEIEETARAAG